MAQVVTTQKGLAQTGKTGSPSRLKVSSPKQSPGREIFGKGSPRQDCKTVRSTLRKGVAVGSKRM